MSTRDIIIHVDITVIIAQDPTTTTIIHLITIITMDRVVECTYVSTYDKSYILSSLYSEYIGI